MSVADNTARQAAVSFEAVKVSFNQNKDGYMLRLAVHPNEVPESILRDWVGSRYMIAMVKLADDDTPEVPQQKTEAERAIAIASALGRDEAFREWAFITHNAEDALKFIKDRCGIVSRSEFNQNREARDKLFALRDEYMRSGKNDGR